MHILWMTPRIAHPPDTGGTVITAYLVRHLAARGHRITLVPFSEVRGTPNWEEGIEVYTQTFLVPHRHSPGRLLLSSLSSRPYAISRYIDRRVSQEIAKVLDPSRYDLIQVDHLHLAEYGLLEGEQLPRALLMHNVESVLWERIADVEPHPIKRAFWRHQAKVLRRYETAMLSRYNAVIALSSQDAAYLQQLCPHAHVIAIPPGVDREFFHPWEIAEESWSVTFVGPLDWLPNADGVRWFCRQIWPRVKAKIPQARCYIVGRQPPTDLLPYTRQDVVLMGYAQDVRPIVARTSVFIVPMRIGSGVRLKILHALAMGKAVVTTSLGCEGLELTNGEHLWVADTAEEFAAKVSALLHDPATRRRLGEAGGEQVRERYSWLTAAAALEALYQRLCARRS